MIRSEFARLETPIIRTMNFIMKVLTSDINIEAITVIKSSHFVKQGYHSTSRFRVI